MLKVRIIPCLDVKDGRTVKGVNFVDLRDAGDPVEQAAVYDAMGADELAFLDIAASVENRATLYDVVARTAEQCFMPLTVGGGVREVEDVRRLLLAGADKVSINTAAVGDPDFVRRAADKFGSQCITVAIDAKAVAADRWEVFTHGGSRTTGLDAVAGPSAWSRRRGRVPADLDGSRRHRPRLRSGAVGPVPPTACRCRSSPPAASADSTTWWRGLSRVMPAPCWPPRSSISAVTPSPTPSGPWPHAGVPVRL